MDTPAAVTAKVMALSEATFSVNSMVGYDTELQTAGIWTFAHSNHGENYILWTIGCEEKSTDPVNQLKRGVGQGVSPVQTPFARMPPSQPTMAWHLKGSVDVRLKKR